MEYTIVHNKPDSFDVDEFVLNSNEVILFNNEAKEQYFLGSGLRFEFVKRLDASIKAGKPLDKHRFRIFLAYGKNQNGKYFTTIKGIDILDEIVSNSHDF